MALHLIGLALLMGALISVYVPMISKSAQILGSGPLANVPFFAVALFSSLVIAFATGSRTDQFQKIVSLPVWLLTAGIMSAVMIIGSSYLVPRIGIGAFFVLMVSGQILAGMVFGYLGLFGVPPSALTFGKVVGAVLVISGVYLVTYR